MGHKAVYFDPYASEDVKMNFIEIATPYEKKKMIVYKSNGDGITRRNISVRHVEGCL